MSIMQRKNGHKGNTMQKRKEIEQQAQELLESMLEKAYSKTQSLDRCDLETEILSQEENREALAEFIRDEFEGCWEQLISDRIEVSHIQELFERGTPAAIYELVDGILCKYFFEILISGMSCVESFIDDKREAMQGSDRTEEQENIYFDHFDR